MITDEKIQAVEESLKYLNLALEEAKGYGFVDFEECCRENIKDMEKELEELKDIKAKEDKEYFEDRRKEYEGMV